MDAQVSREVPAPANPCEECPEAGCHRTDIDRGDLRCGEPDYRPSRMEFYDTEVARMEREKDAPEEPSTISAYSPRVPRSPHQNVLLALPEDKQARKATPICTGVLDYFPAAIAAVAQLSKQGNDQHNPGEPLHWARSKSSDHADCIIRHLAQRGTWDIVYEDGHEVGRTRHSAAVAWRALALLQEEIEAEAGFNPNSEDAG